MAPTLETTQVASGDNLAKQIAGLIDSDIKSESNNTTSAEDTAETIDSLLKQTLAKDDPDAVEDFLYTLWDVVVKAVLTIPATDPRMEHLINVIAALKARNTAEVEIWDAKVSIWKDLPMLGAALRDAWNFKPEFDDKQEPDHAAVQRWVSLNSFAARLLGKQLQTSFNLGLWELRSALEEDHPSDAARDLHLNTASEWLQHAGAELHRLSHASAGSLDEQDVKITGSGDLIPAKTKGPSAERWSFWRKRLAELSHDLTPAAKEECLKERVDGVISQMEAIEEEAHKS